MKPITLLVAGLLAVTSHSTPRSGHIETFHHENVLGTSFELKVIAAQPADAQRAEKAALDEIDRQAKLLSSYDPNSEFSRWMRTSGHPVRISPELFEILGLFDQWRERTGGALDASAEALIRVWKKAAAAGRSPTGAEIAGAVDSVRRPHWRLDAAAGTATHLSDTPLVLNSFTKSYIIGRAADAALAAGNVAAVVVNIGGDIVVRGNWTEPVEIADPLSDAENSSRISRLLIRDRALATSGNYRRGVKIGGRHYSHIVDPRSGMPADEVISASVVAASPTDAGALATAFSILAHEESERLAATVRGTEFLLVRKDGSRVMSRGWHAMEAPMAAAPAVYTASLALYAAQDPGTWNPAFELTISLELARIQEERFRRPYVAVWIEDKDKFPLRTLAVWYQKPRWLPDLKIWYHHDRLRLTAEKTDLVSSVSSATRPPGKYTLKWDGKDNHGKLVRSGRYAVHIEAAREHGTYQLIRQEMDFTGVPRQIQLTGNVEVASAALDYHQISQ